MVVLRIVICTEHSLHKPIPLVDMYNIRSPPPARETIVIEDGCRLRVECLGRVLI